MATTEIEAQGPEQGSGLACPALACRRYDVERLEPVLAGGRHLHAEAALRPLAAHHHHPDDHLAVGGDAGVHALPRRPAQASPSLAEAQIRTQPPELNLAIMNPICAEGPRCPAQQAGQPKPALWLQAHRLQADCQPHHMVHQAYQPDSPVPLMEGRADRAGARSCTARFVVFLRRRGFQFGQHDQSPV